MPMENIDKDCMTIKEVMELTGKTRQTVDLWTRQGLTKHYNLLHGLHFIRSEVMAFLTLERPIKSRGRNTKKQVNPATVATAHHSHQKDCKKQAIFKGTTVRAGRPLYLFQIDGEQVPFKDVGEGSLGERIGNEGLQPGQAVTLIMKGKRLVDYDLDV